jgi:hypothetical protein
MTTAETVLLIAALLLIILVVGNVVFSKLAERRNPPVGKFIEYPDASTRPRIG